MILVIYGDGSTWPVMSASCPLPAPLHVTLTAARAALRRRRHEPSLSLRERDRVAMFLLSDAGWRVSRLAPFRGKRRGWRRCGYSHRDRRPTGHAGPR